MEGKEGGGNPPLVAVSVVHWTGWEDTRRCLRSVLELEDPNLLLVLVDNESTRESRGRIRDWAEEHLPSSRVAWYGTDRAEAGGEAETERRLEDGHGPRLAVLRSGENLGFTGGHNVAVAYALRRPAPARWVFHLNNDALLRGGDLRDLIREAEGEGVPTLAVPWNRERAPVRELWWPFRAPRRDEGKHAARSEGERDRWWVVAAALLVPADLLRALEERDGHWWNEDLYLYMDDVEFSLRARELGAGVAVSETVEFVHRPASSSGGSFSPLQYYYTCRNRKLLLRQWAPPWLRAPAFAADLAADLFRVGKNLAAGRWLAARAVAAGSAAGLRGETGKARDHDRLAGRTT